ncbi:MAG: methylated-DNA--[protein]-cysteine S-methyltransferase [Gammaproteobacteria bacterium]|nr:methylated-DNA--[protein]-cysteine S-methyltransferase [Gammaproteobacteria bacterium]
METVYYDYLDSPIGSLMLAGDGENLVELGFPDGKAARRHQPGWVLDSEPFTECKRQLQRYFAGNLRDFDIPLAPRGTEFQLLVWDALRTIPYGETVSYGELARQIGRPAASRAVGAANGKNPIPVIIPCHRVIGSTGSLVGFGGGLPTKQQLLALEREAIAPGLL